jgi:hypothetical protein
MNLSQSFGNALNTLKVDTNSTEIPKSTLEIVSNVLSNLQTKESPSLTSNEPFRHDNTNKNNDSSKPTASTSSTPSSTDSTTQKTKLSVWKLLKVSLILAFTFVLLSTEFFKNLMTKVTNNHIISVSILAVVFIMISFCSMKWML